MIIRLSLIISIFSLMMGCATYQVPLSKKAQEHIQSADTILFIPQNNLDVKIIATDSSKQGLIGMLVAAGIDSVRQSSAEEKAAPIIQQLQDYDFRVVMLNALQAEIPKVTTIKVNTPIQLETIDFESQKRISFDKASSSAVLFNTVKYRYESGNLIITANVEMYPKVNALLKFRNRPNNENPVNAGNIIYRQRFTFTKQAITADNIKDSLAEGAASIAKQVVADLNHPL